MELILEKKIAKRLVEECEMMKNDRETTVDDVERFVTMINSLEYFGIITMSDKRRVQQEAQKTLDV